MSTSNTEVLVVGAGPTGLVLALWLTKLGIRFRIIDKTAEAGTTSRAVAIQARTLEFYRQLGFAEEVVSRGRRANGVNLWVAGEKKAHAELGGIGEGLSPYPFALIFPQDEHERLLIDHLSQLGVTVERRTQLLSFEETANGIRATLQHDDSGTSETCEALYIAGCDGAHSVVRKQIGIGFPGGTYEHVFYVADVVADGEVMNGELHVGFDRTDFLAVFPLPGDNHARLVGTVREQDGPPPESLAWQDVSPRVREWMHVNVQKVNWFSTYRVHHRVAEHFRKGRAFLSGDAAHVHSPVGGQGMNTGIGDGVNLAWKLAAVIKRHAPASILDTYEPERIAFARRLVATTDRAFTGVTSTSATARFLRLHLTPLLFPALLPLHAVQQKLFRTVSQTLIQYRDSALSEGKDGPLHGGDRLPWVSLGPESDNFAPLQALDWQVHVYGQPTPLLQELCQRRNLALHVFPWSEATQHAGIRHNTAVLIRPDGYTALVMPHSDAAMLAAYLDRRQISSFGAEPANRAVV